MNEYLDAWSAARLIGTFRRARGLAHRPPSAASRFPWCCSMKSRRRIPRCSICCLQVLGEGRLTDALGRTADFGNAIIIMTSNLGVREAGTSLRPAARRHSPTATRMSPPPSGSSGPSSSIVSIASCPSSGSRANTGRRHRATAHRRRAEPRRACASPDACSPSSRRPWSVLSTRGFIRNWAPVRSSVRSNGNSRSPSPPSSPLSLPDAPAVIHLFSHGDQIDVNIETIRYARAQRTQA